MFDVFNSWRRGEKFTLRNHLTNKHYEKDNRIKAKYEIIDGEEVNNGKALKKIIE
jgi:hypothetical protein